MNYRIVFQNTQDSAQRLHEVSRKIENVSITLHQLSKESQSGLEQQMQLLALMSQRFKGNAENLFRQSSNLSTMVNNYDVAEKNAFGHFTDILSAIGRPQAVPPIGTLPEGYIPSVTLPDGPPFHRPIQPETLPETIPGGHVPPTTLPEDLPGGGWVNGPGWQGGGGSPGGGSWWENLPWTNRPEGDRPDWSTLPGRLPWLFIPPIIREIIRGENGCRETQNRVWDFIRDRLGLNNRPTTPDTGNYANSPGTGTPGSSPENNPGSNAGDNAGNSNTNTSDMGGGAAGPPWPGATGQYPPNTDHEDNSTSRNPGINAGIGAGVGAGIGAGLGSMAGAGTTTGADSANQDENERKVREKVDQLREKSEDKHSDLARKEIPIPPPSNGSGYVSEDIQGGYATAAYPESDIADQLGNVQARTGGGGSALGGGGALGASLLDGWGEDGLLDTPDIYSDYNDYATPADNYTAYTNYAESEDGYPVYTNRIDAEKAMRGLGLVGAPVLGAAALGSLAMSGVGLSNSMRADGGGNNAKPIPPTVQAKQGQGLFSGNINSSYVMFGSTMALAFAGGSIVAGGAKKGAKDKPDDNRYRIGYGVSAVLTGAIDPNEVPAKDASSKNPLEGSKK